MTAGLGGGEDTRISNQGQEQKVRWSLCKSQPSRTHTVYGEDTEVREIPGSVGNWGKAWEDMVAGSGFISQCAQCESQDKVGKEIKVSYVLRLELNLVSTYLCSKVWRKNKT